MAEPGIFDAKNPEDAIGLYDRQSRGSSSWEYFVDGRPGEDRWGNPRAKRRGCGTGFGPDDYVCPAYLDESCPGDGNAGVRTAPNLMAECDLNCGECGGGGWIKDGGTMAYCGQLKQRAMSAVAYAEMGGSFRLDRFVAAGGLLPDGIPAAVRREVLPHAPAEAFPVRYFPTAEWYAKGWYPKLAENYGGPYPMMATTMKTGLPSSKARDFKTWQKGPRTLLRDRLGGFDGQLLVNGLTKDDIIDDAWDCRRRAYDFFKASDVDFVVTPQYSAYPEQPLFHSLYNANRIFRWYQECMDIGFPKVVLDLPVNVHADWLMDEFWGFIERVGVQYVSVSLQQYKTRGGLAPEACYALQQMNEKLPAGVALLVFGAGTPSRMATTLTLLEGRELTFSTVEAAARAVFYQMIPGGNSAPPGMEKDDVYAHNVLEMLRITSLVFDTVRSEDSAAATTKKTPARRRRARR